VAARIQDYYGFPALAIVAPAYADDIYTFDSQSKRSEAYLWVGRIVEPYKRLSLLIEYFERNPRKTLVVAGDGRDRRKLERYASKNVKFVGWQNEEQLAALYRSTNALIFPSEDDFGITALEAMACGLPVIAYGAGGALDTVVEAESGVFFPDPTVESLHIAMEKFESITWNNIEIAKSVVEKFGRERFDVEIREVLESLDVRG
jgi:glycosyltransferase involved in cell wall biosynthesis